MYGQEFKNIRLQEGLSLKQAVGNKISYSTLSRWENSKSDIKFEDLLTVLGNIKVTLKEFNDICQINHIDESIQELAKAYDNNQASKIKQLYQQQQKKYDQSKTQYDFFLLAIICNCYLDITGKNIFPDFSKKKLFYILSNINEWTELFINVFGNTAFLYTSLETYNIASHILNDLKKRQNIEFDRQYYYLSAVINAQTNLILTSPELAKKLEKKLNKINIQKPISYLFIRRNFLHALLKYRLSKDNADEEKIIEIISSIKILGLRDIAQSFEFLLNKLKSI